MIVESYEDVIVLSGVLRSNYWETLHTAISLTLKRHPSGVIIDCSGLTEATAEGVGTFRDVMEFIRGQEARLILASVPEHILEVLRSVPEVRSQLAIAESTDDARRSLDLLQHKPTGRKKAAAQTASKLAVVLIGGDADRETLNLASQIAEAREAEMHLIFVVLVPRDLPLTAPMPKEEGQAAAAIDFARATVDRKNVVPHIERGRDLASTIESFLLALKGTIVVLPVTNGQVEMEGWAKLFRTLVTRLSQEVVFVKGAAKC